MVAQTDQDVPKVVLNEGEILCDRCNGSGNEPKTHPEAFFTLVCQKCQGEKKVDWVSNITGVKEKEYLIGADSSRISSFDSTHLSSTLNIDGDFKINGQLIEEYVREIAAEEIAKKVDREVLRILKENGQQNNKNGRKFFDNRIFSKFLFFDYFKQKNKTKED